MVSGNLKVTRHEDTEAGSVQGPILDTQVWLLHIGMAANRTLMMVISIFLCEIRSVSKCKCMKQRLMGGVFQQNLQMRWIISHNSPAGDLYFMTAEMRVSANFTNLRHTAKK